MTVIQSKIFTKSHFARKHPQMNTKEVKTVK